MSASPSPVAAVAAVAAATLAAPSKWQRLVALARLVRDQLRRYREVAPVAGDQTVQTANVEVLGFWLNIQGEVVWNR